MAKPVFDKALFKAGQQKAAERKFPEIGKGIYNCEIKKACIETAKNSGRLQAKFEFQISEDSPEHKNQYLWNYIGLADKEGNQQEQGYEILSVILNILKVDPNIDDIDAALESTIGTKVRIDYTPRKDETEYDKLRVTKVLEMPNGQMPPSAYGSDRSDELDANVASAEAEGTQVTLDPGDICTLTTGGKVVVVSMLDSSESGDGGQYIMAYPQGTSMAKMAKFSCELIADVEKALPAGATSEGPAKTATAPAASTAKPTAAELDELDGPVLEEELLEEETLEESWKVGDKVGGNSVKTGKFEVGEIYSIEGEVVKIKTADTPPRGITVKFDTIKRA